MKLMENVEKEKETVHRHFNFLLRVFVLSRARCCELAGAGGECGRKAGAKN